MGELSDMYRTICDTSGPIRQANRIAESLKVFAAGDDSIIIGEWKEWQRACLKSGTALDPADFKKRPSDGVL